MFGITRKRLAVLLSAFTITFVLVLILGTVALAGGPIVHRVHVGGPDGCAGLGLDPGCDANFSLNAKLFADGSVRGQYTDRFFGGVDGLHAVIDCLVVDGDEAWVSGVITHGNIGGNDLAGFPVGTRVRDNGTSANDPADQISFSFIADVTCTEKPDFPLNDMPQGQVVIK